MSAALFPTAIIRKLICRLACPGIGLVIMLAFLTFVGFITAGFAGRTLVRTGERLLSRMPIIRSVYGTLKQIFETVLNHVIAVIS